MRMFSVNDTGILGKRNSECWTDRNGRFHTEDGLFALDGLTVLMGNECS